MASSRFPPIDPMSHVAARFSHGLLMVAELVRRTDDLTLDRVVQIACLEDWFTNYRLLIEFLLMKPPGNCAGAADLAPGWVPPESQVIRSLKADYGWASEDVSHIGIPKPRKLVGNIHPAALKIKVLWVFEVADEFTAELAKQGSPYADLIANGLAAARAAL